MKLNLMIMATFFGFINAYAGETKVCKFTAHQKVYTFRLKNSSAFSGNELASALNLTGTIQNTTAPEESLGAPVVHPYNSGEFNLNIDVMDALQKAGADPTYVNQVKRYQFSYGDSPFYFYELYNTSYQVFRSFVFLNRVAHICE